MTQVTTITPDTAAAATYRISWYQRVRDWLDWQEDRGHGRWLRPFRHASRRMDALYEEMARNRQEILQLNREREVVFALMAEACDRAGQPDLAEFARGHADPESQRQAARRAIEAARAAGLAIVR